MTTPDDREQIALLVHEVRSPTAALAAILSALTEAEVDAESLRTLVELSLAACDSINRILGDAALGTLRLEDVDIGAIVRGAVTSAVLGGGRVRANVDAEAPVIVGDPVRLRQALDNLIENAVAASGPDGEVNVGVHADDQAVVVSVADCGEGIPVGEQARIFEAGARLGPRDDGRGLGLAIVRAVAEGHGGTAAVESSPGNGATFTITLPIDRGHPAGTSSST